jgi:hypothetical protein
LTILETIASKGKGWKWHPGVTMWAGSEELLAYIAVNVNEEWAQQVATSRGETRASMNGLVKQYHEQLEAMGFDLKELKSLVKTPWWWGHERFHEGEKSMLLRHDPEWYGQFFPKTPNNLCEWWPRLKKNEWVYGPHMGPNGDYTEYHIYDKPIYRAARVLSNADFAHHANVYHNLLPDIKTPIDAKEPIMASLRVLHDRFHQKRVYHSHDHSE